MTEQQILLKILERLERLNNDVSRIERCMERCTERDENGDPYLIRVRDK